MNLAVLNGGLIPRKSNRKKVWRNFRITIQNATYGIPY